jgi:hypothetical protein
MGHLGADVHPLSVAPAQLLLVAGGRDTGSVGVDPLGAERRCE